MGVWRLGYFIVLQICNTHLYFVLKSFYMINDSCITTVIAALQKKIDCLIIISQIRMMVPATELFNLIWHVGMYIYISVQFSLILGFPFYKSSWKE